MAIQILGVQVGMSRRGDLAHRSHFHGLATESHELALAIPNLTVQFGGAVH